jgi:hypothetical protein
MVTAVNQALPEDLVRSYDSFRGAFAFFASKFHLDG